MFACFIKSKEDSRGPHHKCRAFIVLLLIDAQLTY